MLPTLQSEVARQPVNTLMIKSKYFEDNVMFYNNHLFDVTFTCPHRNIFQEINGVDLASECTAFNQTMEQVS